MLNLQVWMCEREWVPRICSAPATILFAFLQRHSTLAKSTAHGPRGSFCTQAERGQVTGSNTRKGRRYFCQWHETLALQPTLVLTGPGVEVSKAHKVLASEESEHPEASGTRRDSPGRLVTLVHWVSLALWNLSIKHNFHALPGWMVNTGKKMLFVLSSMLLWFLKLLQKKKFVGPWKIYNPRV